MLIKYLTILYALIAYAAAKPGLVGAPLAYTLPAVAPAAAVIAAPAPVVTATSSQVISRNYNGVAHAPVLAPLAAAPLAAAPLAAAVAPTFNPAFARYAASPLFASYTAPAFTAASAPAPPLAYTAPITSNYYHAAPARFSYAPSFAAGTYVL